MVLTSPSLNNTKHGTDQIWITDITVFTKLDDNKFNIMVLTKVK